jgi:hypothetical protein
MAFCPRCGAEFPFEGAWLAVSSVRCRDCGLALSESPPMLAHTAAELEYVLEDWPVKYRAAATAALVQADIPYRWEAGLVLVVPASAEEHVDRLLDDLEGGDVRPGDDLAADMQDDQADGGEEAQVAMADLFLASDRLQHAPWDEGMGRQLVQVAAKVKTCLPPYGIEGRVWGQIGTLASALASSLEDSADDDAIRQNARALRDALRAYV